MSERSLSPLSFRVESRLSLLSAEESGPRPTPEQVEDSILSFSPPCHRRPRTQVSHDAGSIPNSQLKRSPSETRLPSHPNPTERLSTLYTSSSFFDSRTIAYPVFSGPHSDAAEGSTFDHFRYEQSVRPSTHWSLGLYPVRVYCSNCKIEVSTQVTTRQPQPLPAFLTFLDDFIHCCRHKADHPAQELVHSCARCKRILARVILE